MEIGSGHHAATGPAGPATRASVNPLAYDRVLLAHYFFQRRGAGDLERARQFNEEALAIDPRCARAWAGLASIHWIDTMEGRSPMEAGLEQVRVAAEQALALDPGSAEAHIRLGLYLPRKGDRRGAEEHVHQAALLEPNNPLALGFAAGAAAEEHRIDDAIALQRRAVLADPLSTVQRTNLADLLLGSGRTAAERSRREPGGSALPTTDAASPFLAPLRENARWQAWLASVRPQD